jgi:preprotein translocase subunit SecE
MPDDQIIALLTEIRDLLKQNSENIKASLQNQVEAMEFQRRRGAEIQKMFVTRQKMVFIFVIVLVVISFIVITLASRIMK